MTIENRQARFVANLGDEPAGSDMNVRLVYAQNGEPSTTIEDFPHCWHTVGGMITIQYVSIRPRFRALVPRPLSYWGSKTANGLPRIGR